MSVSTSPVYSSSAAVGKTGELEVSDESWEGLNGDVYRGKLVQTGGPTSTQGQVLERRKLEEIGLIQFGRAHHCLHYFRHSRLF